MITIIVAIIFAALSPVLGSWGTIFGAVVLVLAGFVLILPVEGFHKPTFSEKELIPLRNIQNVESPCYVIYKPGKATFAYDNRAKYSLSGIAYEEGAVEGKIRIYEADECKVPVLKECKIKPKRGDFTFAPFSSKKEYVFYVPTGSVFKGKAVRK